MERDSLRADLRHSTARGALLLVAALVAALGAGACDDGSNDSGIGGISGFGGTSTGSGGLTPTGVGSSSGGGGGGGSSSGSVSGSSGGGIVGVDGGLVGDATTGSSQGRALFEALYQNLDSTCGGACHVMGAGGAPQWLGPPDAYTSATKFPGIVTPDPDTSVVVTKGRHEGPPLADPLLTQVLEWLTAEAAALPVTMLPASPAFTPQTGANDIDCSAAGIPGLHVTFTASISGTLITLTDLNLVTPATTGAQITYPIFAILPQGGAEIDDASLSNLSETFPAATTSTLGPGTLVLTDWSAGAQMKIEFTMLAKAAVMDGGSSTTGGCKSLTTFTQDAVPAIQANTCLDCHETGGSGNASLDLSGLASNPTDLATACAQALTRANPQNPAQSDIILAPTGQVANHPFKNASQSFVTMMETWIAAEK